MSSIALTPRPRTARSAARSVAAVRRKGSRATALIQDRLIRQWSGWCGAVFDVAGPAGAVGVQGDGEAAG